MEVSSINSATILTNKNRSYEFENFKYYINKKLLKANNVYINENILLKKSETDHLYFRNGFFDLEDRSFLAEKTTIKLKKNIFDSLDNDPRLIGQSSSSKDGITSVKKGIFTSCKKNDDCPPWSISAKKITHDKNKKQLIYDDAILKVYNAPVFYFPKFSS